jgi:hypothetical protein
LHGFFIASIWMGFRFLRMKKGNPKFFPGAQALELFSSKQENAVNRIYRNNRISSRRLRQSPNLMQHEWREC